MDERGEENLAVLKAVLEDNLRPQKSEAEAKSQHFYRACMKASETSKTTLEQIVKDVGGWNLSGEPSEMRHFDMRKKMLSIQKYTTTALFKW